MSGDTNLSEEDQEMLVVMLSKFKVPTTQALEFHEILVVATELSRHDALAYMRERLSPTVLINNDITGDRTFYYGLRDVLKAFKVNIQEGPGVDVIVACINALYVGLSEWTTIATDRLNSFNAIGTPSIGSHRFNESATGDNIDGNSMDRTRSNINTPSHSEAVLSKNKSAAGNSFRTEKQKFTGSNDTPVTLHRFRQVYSTVMAEYNIPRQVQVSLMHHALSGLAKDFFFDKIQHQCTTLGEAYSMLQERFDNESTRVQMKARIDNISIGSLRKEHSISTEQALHRAFKMITDLAPMCGPDMSGDSHKCSYLAAAVRHEHWANFVCTQRLTTRMDYATFYNMLHASLTQKSLSGVDHETPSFAAMAYNNHFGSQYAQPRKPNNSSYRPRQPRKKRTLAELQELKKRTRCLKCGEVGHWRAECPKRDLSLTDAIRSRIVHNGKNNKAVADVLFAMVQEDDEFNEYIHLSNVEPEPDNPFTSYMNMENQDTNEDAASLFDNFCDVLDITPVPEESKDKHVTFSENHFCYADNFSEDQDAQHIPFAINLTTVAQVPCAIEYLNKQFYQHEHEAIFSGALLDTGAQRSVIGLRQTMAYFKLMSIEKYIQKSDVIFMFGTTKVEAIGMVEISIPTPTGSLEIQVDVVQEDIPFLLGIDLMDKHGLQLLNVYNLLECVPHNWKIPIQRKRGHCFLVWNSKDARNVLFTKAELTKMHKHLAHPSSKKLYSLLKRATSGKLPWGTSAMIDRISKSCRTCTEFSPKTVSFRIRDVDKVVFNHRITLDLMYLPALNNRKFPVLHIVDVGTKFNAAAFLRSENTTHIWNTFVQIWATLYIGMPESMLVDQGSVFVSDEWKYACEINDIEFKETGTESHNSLGAGETYHAIVRRIYMKLRRDYPKLTPKLLLAMAIKAVNDSAGPEGLVPSLLVFGTMPKLPNVARLEHETQKNRLRAATTARLEYEKIVCARRVQLALKSRPPPNSNQKYFPGDMIYVYREKIRQWTGPHMVASSHGKGVRVHTGDTKGPKLFNIAQTRLSELPNSIEDGLEEPAYKTTVLHTEVLKAGDPRECKFDEAKRQELMGLIDRGTFRIVLREEAGEKPNIIPARFVLAIKHNGDGSEKLKARFVVGGHRDREAAKIVHNSTTLRPTSLRLLIALATILGFDIWSTDMKQGYLQSASDLQRKIFTKPKILDLGKNELLQIVRPLYGLPDSGEYWCETLSHHYRKHLRFYQATSDFALFFRHAADKLVSICGTYVDDNICAGTTAEKKRIIETMEKQFDIVVDDTDLQQYVGCKIDMRNKNCITISQPNHVKRIEILELNATYSKYRSMRARMAWLTQTRPDIVCAISFAATVTEKNFGKDSIKDMNKITKYVKGTPNVGLKFPRLEENSLRLVVYVDGSFNNRDDSKSQIGHIMLLADASNKCCILQFVSRKSRRVTRSTTSAEAFAFADGFDAATVIRHDLEMILRTHVPLIMMTDSEILFSIIVRNRQTSEKRLMIDIRAIREAYAERVISNIALIASEHNIADAMTKIGHNTSLDKLLQTSIIEHPIRQYVIERSIPSNVLKKE